MNTLLICTVTLEFILVRQPQILILLNYVAAKKYGVMIDLILEKGFSRICPRYAHDREKGYQQ